MVLLVKYLAQKHKSLTVDLTLMEKPGFFARVPDPRLWGLGRINRHRQVSGALQLATVGSK